MNALSLADVLQQTKTIKWKEHKNEVFDYIDLTSVDRKSHTVKETSTINSANAPSRAKKIVHTNDILFGTTRPTLNRLCVVPDKYDNQICSTGLCVLRANEELVLPRYIYHLLNSSLFLDYIESLQRGTSYPAVTDKDVKSFKFLLPTLLEQEKVVAKLDSAFEKIDRTINLQRKKKSLLERYLESSIEISFSDEADSKKVLIQDVATVRGGKRLPKGSGLKSYKTPYPYIRVTDFDKKGGIKESGIQYLDEETHRQISNYTISKSDVFLSIAGSIGVTGIIPKALHGANLTENACKITPSITLDQEYLYYFTLTKSFIEQAAGATRQTAQPKLALIRIKNIHLNLPGKQAQEKIAAHLKNLSFKVNEAIKLCRGNIENLEKLKESMLEQSFSIDGVE